MDALTVPVFHRLTDYLGVWCIEPSFFRSHWQAMRDLDWAAHLQTEQPPLVSLTEMVQTKQGSNVAVIPLQGLLMKARSSAGGTSTVQARRDLRAAANDPNISAILLGIDSPGGTVAGTADLAQEVRTAKKSKPVWAFVEDLGASAAYHVASQADRIFAGTQDTLVGSIGTMSVVHDMSAAAEAQGVKTLVFATGPLKGAGVPGAKVTDEQQAHFQGLVNSLQTTFDAAVRQGRNLSAKELEQVRTGGIWTAQTAQGLKLIDGVQTLAKTLADLGAEASRATRPARSRQSTDFDLALSTGLAAGQF